MFVFVIAKIVSDEENTVSLLDASVYRSKDRAFDALETVRHRLPSRKTAFVFLQIIRSRHPGLTPAEARCVHRRVVCSTCDIHPARDDMQIAMDQIRSTNE